MVAKLHNCNLPNDQTEDVMQTLNKVLEIHGDEYRFPKTVATFVDRDPLKALSTDGIKHYAACPSCHHLSDIKSNPTEEAKTCNQPLKGVVFKIFRMSFAPLSISGWAGWSRRQDMFSVSFRPIIRSGFCLNRSLPRCSCMISPSIISWNRWLGWTSYLHRRQHFAHATKAASRLWHRTDLLDDSLLSIHRLRDHVVVQTMRQWAITIELDLWSPQPVFAMRTGHSISDRTQMNSSSKHQQKQLFWTSVRGWTEHGIPLLRKASLR